MSAVVYHPGDVIDAVPIFPLPQVVLFPGTLMPLHIFEPRYRRMTRDALAAGRQLSVAFIPEDHRVDRYGRPDIAQIGGLGEIVHHEALPDGRYNLLLKGRARVRIEELPLERPYRQGRLTVLGSCGRPRDNGAEVRALVTTAMAFAARVRECHPSFNFSVPETDEPGAIVDTCAHYLVLDGEDRQQLLETLDVAERVRRCLQVLMTQSALLEPDDEVVH